MAFNYHDSAACPACGLLRNKWIVGNGQGFAAPSGTYCCRGCAEGTGCICRHLITQHRRRSRYRQTYRF